MTVKSYKLTAGTLLFGTAPLDVSAQTTKITIKAAENVATIEAVPVLTGGELPAEDDVIYTWAMEATLLQDLDVAGVIEWSWNNKGTWQPFVFIPSNAADRGVSGECRPVPLDIGGDVKTRPTSDLTWVVRGSSTVTDPTFGVADAVAGEVTEDV